MKKCSRVVGQSTPRRESPLDLRKINDLRSHGHNPAPQKALFRRSMSIYFSSALLLDFFSYPDYIKPRVGEGFLYHLGALTPG
jgi:hypothetical protein